MMRRDALTRWNAAAVSGEVTIELRRGDDYTILDTQGDALTYGPERLSMERSATAFTAADRIGQLAVNINPITEPRRLRAQLGGALGPSGPDAAAAPPSPQKAASRSRRMARSCSATTSRARS